MEDFMINNVTITGRLTADPEIRYAGDDNVCVCNFSVAHTRPLGKNGERITDFFDCVAWRGKAEFLERNFSKGDMIAITGKLYSESFVDKNDTKRTAIKIRVNEINFAGTTKKQRENSKDGIPEGLEGMLNVPDDVSGYFSEDDDLPF